MAYFPKRSLFLVLLLVLSVKSVPSQVVINEIMYNTQQSDLEYVELLNPSQTAVDLGGWILRDQEDDHTFVLPEETQIDGNGYLVIADSAEMFRTLYGFDVDVTGFSFDFANSGDAVRLFDAAGACVESVTYDDRTPWSELADGNGSSLERLNPRLPSELASSWDASSPQGTPGERNSVFTEDLPPVITAVDHTPRIPEPGESVTVAARVFDVDGDIGAVYLHHGEDNGTVYRRVEMFDDGEHGDGGAGDRVYGAQIPGADLSSILRFYIEAVDTQDLVTSFPKKGGAEPLLTVVERRLEERVPILRIVMRPEVQRQFLDQYRTDIYSPATFYDGDTVYYAVHIRHRGRSRSQNARFKIRFPHSQLYRNKIRRLNLNGTDPNSLLQEYLSYQLYGDAGLPNLESEIVRFHINGKSADGIPYRVAIENPGSQFLRRHHFFKDDNGNLYKTTLDGTPQNKATWRYVGDDPSLYQDCYIKQTNEEEADWSDIVRFCRILTVVDTWDPRYTQAVRSVLETDVFLKWMAVSALVAHWDSPYTDHGHNYVLYNDPTTGLLNILAWDLNGTFNYSSNHESLNYRKHYTHIRSTKFEAINKILNHPVFGGQYYKEIDRLMDTLFTQNTMDRRIDEAAHLLHRSSSQVSYLKNYVRHRRIDLANWINRSKGMAFLTKPVYQALVGDMYVYHAAAVDYRRDNPIRYELREGPNWLSVDENTGVVSGTPSAEGRFEVVLAAITEDGTEVLQTYTLQVTDPRPSLIMTFNEATGFANDLSDNENRGDLRGDAKRVDGRLGRAVYLDGSNDYVRVSDSDSLDLSGEVTVEAWIQPDSISGGNPVIVTKGTDDLYNYALMLGYGPFSWDRMEPCFMPHRFDIEHRVTYGRKEIEAQLVGRRWYHIAGTYSSETERVRVYCNDRRICESASRALMPENDAPLMIGLSGGRCFRGAVDDVKILPFAKWSFAAGLCLSRVEVSGISPAQDRVGLALSDHRRDSINTGDYAIYLMNAGKWLPLPEVELRGGESVTWWMDDLGLDEPLRLDEILALYPLSSMGEPSRRTILDMVAWGPTAPSVANPGVQAAVWLNGRSLSLGDNEPSAMTLINFCDNDEMDEDWTVQKQEVSGPEIQSVIINGGAVETDERQVEITLSVTGNPTQMRISNHPNFTSEWREFSSDVTWLLSEEDGPQTVYIQVADSTGERSEVETDMIVLDMETGVEDWEVRM